MLSIRTNTLGGEGWPAAGIAKPTKNRNLCGLLPDRPLQLRAGSSRTKQERAGSVDTPLTQRTGFEFATCSHLINQNAANPSPIDLIAADQSFGLPPGGWPPIRAQRSRAFAFITTGTPIAEKH